MQLLFLLRLTPVAAFVSNNNLNTRRRPCCALFFPPRHRVNGIEYAEVHVELPHVGSVTILEATIETQNILVEQALEEKGSCPMSSSFSQVIRTDPYGAVLWPAARTIASCLLQEQDGSALCRDKIVLELGTGTGLVTLAALMGGARHAIAVDYESVPLSLVEAAARLNGIDSAQLDTIRLDICDPHQPLPHADIVVAADILYEPTTGRALAHRCVEAMRRGACVLVGDSPGRPGRSAFLQELENLKVRKAVFENALGWTVTTRRHELICGPTSTSRTEEARALDVAVMHLDPSMLA